MTSVIAKINDNVIYNQEVGLLNQTLFINEQVIYKPIRDLYTNVLFITEYVFIKRRFMVDEVNHSNGLQTN